MARDYGMIEPFVESQVRAGVISYGVSSYGYDLRVADTFKIFTNVFNVIVDPKHFSPRSFVDIQADYCDIPPNSFALARSVEYFRIPRNVLCIVMGKSTYARCFRGDTKVALVDGTAIALEDMARQAEHGTLFWGYGVGQHGRIIACLLDQPRYVGRDALVEVVLDNGERICCTPDHAFLLRDGRMAPAATLTPGTALLPLYRDIFRGYEMVYQPLTGYLYPTHRLADEWNIRNQIYLDTPGTHRHHVDHNRLNNMPWNITRMESGAHIRHQNAETYGGDFDPIEQSAAIKATLERLAQDDTWYRHYRASQQAKAHHVWHDEAYSAARERLRQTHQAYWAIQAHRELQRQRHQRYWADEERRAERGAFSRAVWARDDGSRRTRQQDCDRSVSRRFPDVLQEFRGNAGRNKQNHKVVEVRHLAGEHDVYCLTVPEAGNFALESGVFVENCGIIVNVTPLEPEWTGYVTIEVSNTSQLPARIYANEGIGQILFFASDEVCDVSYADKQGKYQEQQGIVLPYIEGAGADAGASGPDAGDGSGPAPTSEGAA